MNADFDGLQSVHYIASDPGVKWVKDPEVSIDSDSPRDAQSVLTPNVVRLPEGGFRMYYNGLGPERTAGSSIGYI